MVGSKLNKWAVLALIALAGLLVCGSPSIAVNMLGSQIGLADAAAYWPNVCYNPYSDRYLALWVNVSDPTGWQTKARMADAQTGALIGSEFYISSSPSTLVAVTGNATYNSVNHEWFVVYKADFGIGNLEDIVCQRIASDGTPVGGHVVLVSKSNYQNEQTVAHDPVNNRYLVVWMEVVSTLRVAKGKFFDQAGTPIGSEFQIRDAGAAYGSYEPKACYNPYNDEFMVVWKDYRNYIGTGQDNGYGDIYGQRINANTMAKIGNNIPIYWGGSPYSQNGQDSPGGIVVNPNNGRYFIGFTTLTAEYGWTVRALVANSDGTLYGAIINVTHPLFGTCQGVAFSDYDDTYVIGYQAGDGSFSGRRFTSSGAAIGGEEVFLSPMSSEAGDLAVRGTTGEFLQIGGSSSGHPLKGQRFSFAADTTAPGRINPLRAYKQSDTSVLLTWANPADVDYAGTMIRYRTDSYPTSISDGTLLCNRSTASGASDSFTHIVTAGQAYYYTAFTYDGIPNYSAGANATPSLAWLDEPFDNYGNGFLDGQGGWIKEADKSSCSLQETVKVGVSGRAVEAFGSSTIYDDATIANFGSIAGGYHKITFDMRRDAAATNNQGFIGILQGTTIVSRAYWSTNFSMLTGPGATFTDLVTGPASGQWYHVEIGVNFSNSTLDAWVDGVQKVSAKPFYQAASQINQINITGYSAATVASYLDNLRGERVLASSPPPAPTISSPTLGSNVYSAYPRINWSGDPHDRYEVHINTSNTPADGSSYDSGEVTSGNNYHDVGPLAANQNYYVFVRLRNAVGWGNWSAAGHWFRVVNNGLAPAAPSNFTAMGSNGAVKLSWVNPSDTDLSGVTIRCRTDGYPESQTDGTLVTTTSGAVPGVKVSYTHSGVPNGTKRFYSAFAYDNWGDYSAAATDFTTPEVWAVEYHADTLPSAASPAWTVFADGGSESYSHIESEGGVLHVLDNSTASGSKIRWYRNWSASNTTGSTIITRARCESVAPDPYATNVTMNNGVYYVNFVIFPDRVGAKADATTTIDRQYMLDGTIFHKYRFTLKNGTYACYVDESYSPVFTGTAYTNGQPNQVLLGANGSGNVQSILFDYLCYRTDGGIAPVGAAADVSVLQAKLSPNTTSVRLLDNVVTAAFRDYLYVQPEGGIRGLRVNLPSHGRAVNQKVTVIGLTSTNSDGERCVLAESVTPTGSGSVAAVSMGASVLGGAGLQYDPLLQTGQRGTDDGVGTNNVGLLVRTWGQVVEVDPAGRFFRINDGSGPLKVWTENLAEPTLPYAVVTGISVLDASEGPIAAAIRPRTQGDIEEF